MPDSWIVLQHAPAVVFVFCVGAAVGSFLNVVVYRLPAGMSVAHPPSRCPICGVRLRFFRENMPILGWLMIRGRCRTCGARVSLRYMLVELAMALVFLGLYWLFYLQPSDPWWLGEVANRWWTWRSGFYRTWPAFFVVAFLVASLYAMTVIDARTFTIPIQIPVFVTVAAFLLLTVQGLPIFRPSLHDPWPFYGADWRWSLAAAGGMAGVLLSCALVWLGLLRYSFADYEDYVEEGETLGDYPHARREMGLEIAFLGPILLGLAAGWLLGGLAPDGDVPPRWIQAFGGTGLGYLVGGGIVWVVRILGTLGFGREAMGMGDVHLLAAVGAVLGWPESILIFFLAPFPALLWVAVGAGVGGLFKTRWRSLPFGPYLAMATLIVLLGRPLVDAGMRAVLLVGLPERGLVVAPVDRGDDDDRARTTPIRRTFP